MSATLAALVLATTMRMAASHQYAEGAPPGFSGGFKEESCHACHFHAEPNAPGGMLTIEGVPVGRINGYASETEHQATVFRSGALPLGEHTITVTVSGSRDAASAGHNLILDAPVVEVPQ